MTKKSPLTFAKSTLSTGKNVLGRLQKTASVAGLSALRVAKGEKPDAYLLKETFEKLGVTYIKLGQFIASTPSLFPKEYVVAFADCLDNTTPMPFGRVMAVLEEELAHLGGVDKVFADIEPSCLASASIAQVHKATLLTGETVAIKVQKPEVGTIIHTDLSVLHGVFWVLEKAMPSFKMANLAPIVDEIRGRMLAETDFVAESQALKAFDAFLQSTNNPSVVAPKVFEAFTTKRLLTMSFLDGVSLADPQALNYTAEPKRLMGAVLDTWLLSLLTTGQFHADLHAGNLMVLKTGQVAFLDFGLVGNIEPKSLKACMALSAAVSANDYLALAQAMIDIGMTDENGVVDKERLAYDLADILGVNGQVAQTVKTAHDPRALNALMVEIANIGKRHGIHFPKDFALLLRQMLYFDRFIELLAPETGLFADERLEWLV